MLLTEYQVKEVALATLFSTTETNGVHTDNVIKWTKTLVFTYTNIEGSQFYRLHTDDDCKFTLCVRDDDFAHIVSSELNAPHLNHLAGMQTLAKYLNTLNPTVSLSIFINNLLEYLSEQEVVELVAIAYDLELAEARNHVNG